MTPREVFFAGCYLALCATSAWAQEAGGVTFDRICAADQEPENWLTYSGQYHAQRYSPLDHINRDNVTKLRVKWIKQLDTVSPVEVSPLVVDGKMYITLPQNGVMAIHADSGKVAWQNSERAV